MRPLELVGRRIKVTSSPNPTLVGVEGTVVLETKQTIVIREGKSEKTIIKRTVRIGLDGKEYEGAKLIGNAVERAGAQS